MLHRQNVHQVHVRLFLTAYHSSVSRNVKCALSASQSHSLDGYAGSQLAALRLLFYKAHVWGITKLVSHFCTFRSILVASRLMYSVVYN